MTAAPRITPKTCASSGYFRRRDGTGVAGVPAGVHGQCAAPSIGGKRPDAWRPWRAGSDSCAQWLRPKREGR